MNTTTTITNVNPRVIEFIKTAISDKKERHRKMIESVDPSIIEMLKKMGKIEF